MSSISPNSFLCPLWMQGFKLTWIHLHCIVVWHLYLTIISEIFIINTFSHFSFKECDLRNCICKNVCSFTFRFGGTINNKNNRRIEIDLALENAVDDPITLKGIFVNKKFEKITGDFEWTSPWLNGDINSYVDISKGELYILVLAITK